MAIQNPWWAFRKELIVSEEDRPGVYEVEGGYGEVVYIGGAAKVRSQLQAHLKAPETSCLRKRAVRYRVEYTKNFEKRREELMDEFVRRRGEAPLCNREAEAPKKDSGRRAA